MQWRKSPPALIATFDAVMPGAPAERRLMFGYPAGFLNGNMFVGLHQESFVLRLGEADGAALLREPGGAPFEPMPGRPMRGFFCAPPPVVADRAVLRRWVEKALQHAATMPAKAKKARAAKRTASAKAAPRPAAPRAAKRAPAAKKRV
ncbi:MAG TPA: TfoX/Sxy family protein [Myxococcota bacterium]|jgi:TfoX/Sxy family transcriptional regulator of competence genes|nr:TfoX/Sxy family protein [Myxococcota bacterium]